MADETGFFALLSRMRYISRWGLMRSSIPENIQEHSHEVAVYAHALGLIRAEIFHEDCDAEHLAVLALYHDASEIFTGDLPTPIKYYNPEISESYRKVERVAADKLLSMLPPELAATYRPILREEDADVRRLVKAADKLSAYIKCVEELKAGNLEFKRAAEQTYRALADMRLPELDYFMAHCLDSFSLTLDDLE